MTYKSIFTVWDGLESSRGAFQTTLELARENDAHLEVLCLGYDRLQIAFGYPDVSPTLVNESLSDARKQAEILEQEISGILGVEDVKWSVQTGIAPLSGFPQIVGDATRFNDLVVLPQPYGGDAEGHSASIVEAALFVGNVPVLVHPRNGIETFGKRVTIAWNESDEALAAIRSALPFLKAADSVDVVIIDPARHDADRSDPGAAISTMLSRHGIKVEVSILPRTVPMISDILNRRIEESGSDLLVMGAYGHSRLRERIMGGATRSMLESASIPVLMAH